MPIPRPEQSEAKSEYMKRCVAFLVGDGREAVEAEALALSKWESVDQEHSLAIANMPVKYLLEAMPRRTNQFRKDCIREGDFINVNSDKPLEITRERLEKWAANFALMKANGVNVPIADGHDTSKALGYIVNMMVVDDKDGKARLWCDYQFADDDAVQTAKRARYVSIATDPDYADCEGNEYGEVIQHIAVTATPVITKQKEYVQLSRIEAAINEDEQEVDMDILKEFAALLGIEVGEDMDEEAVKEAVMAKLAELVKPEEDEEEAPEGTEEESLEDEAEVEVPAEDAPAEEAPAPASLSRELAEALAESAETRIGLLVSEGRITPAVGKELRLSLIGKDLDNVNSLTLSKGSAERSIVNTIIDALAKNDPVELAKRTESQIIAGGQRVVKSLEVSEAEAVELTRKEVEDGMKSTLAGQK